ncbi:branched-chain amino acid ABC transporter permease [Nitratireductor basaltis]|uniref:Inner-membrane translocator n=1 Tax=Nitratireductor basaltis TaxID=472175 RepID=A0A084U6F7_9HYPH|nr:branched-chain amino acid ABC transporter permease [Nitratireductor basaltis]KFB08543.1 Inner-membrane translocator [Nitratireductor basaltis]
MKVRLLPSPQSLLLHLAVIAALLAANWLLPEYHRGVVSRVLVLAVFAMGYNLTFGYGGLLSLGHAMFFAAGLYGAGLTIYHLDWSVWPAFGAGIGAGLLLGLVVGALALRTSGVAFMIVTLMFSQVFYLTTLYFTTYTRGEEGLILQQEVRSLELAGATFDLSDPSTRYLAALALFALVLLFTLFVIRSGYGRALIAIRENDERMRMLGFNVFANRLVALTLSGMICAAAGAAYAVLFGYVGSTLASTQYSILPLLWVLLGGAATTLGPLLGTLVMFYVIDIASSHTTAHLLVVGLVLIFLVLFFRRGILGTIRARWLPWLP